MKTPTVCETWIWFLPLLKYDKVDINSYQMIGVALKKLWPLPRANPLRVMAPRS